MPITFTPYSFITPLSVSGCGIWLDSADSSTIVFSSGSNVSSIKDKSGNNNHFTTTVGTPVLIMDGTNQVLDFSQTGSVMSSTYQITYSGSSAFFIVYKKNNAGLNMLLAMTNINYGNAGDTSIRFSNQLVQGSAQQELGLYYTNGTYNYSGYNYNGSYTIIDTVSPNGAGTTYVTYSSTFGSRYFYGQIAEMMYYPAGVTSTQRQQLEGYLAQKWGIRYSLVAGHPGLTNTYYDVKMYNSIVKFTRVPYYTAFTPTSIPTCALWLDAADASTVTGTNPITAWRDKSGNGRTVTITSAPTYGSTTQNGQNTLAFNNNQITTSIASAVGTGDFTLIAVWYQSTGGTNTVLSLGTSASSSQSLGFSGNKYNFYQYGSAQESDYSASAGSWVIQIGTRISSVKTVYINGVAGTTPSTDSFNEAVTTVTIGKGDSFAISGQVGEILVYTGTMTTVNRQLIESYLAQKWGLATQLPANHANNTKPAGLPAAVSQIQLLFTALSRFMSTYYNLSGAYALAGIANTVSLSSGTPAYVWTVAIPSNAKGKNGILAIFFNLYSTTAFLTNQSFDYGVYVDDVAQLLGDSTGTLRYVNAGATNYMMSSGGISLGLNGLVNGFPLIIPVSFLASASQIQIGLKNSSAQMTGVAAVAPAYSSNILTSSGSGGTFIPQNTFSNTGTGYYTVPTNTSQGVPVGVFIYCWGAGGQGSGSGVGAQNVGGGGGFVSAFYSCSPGTNIAYVVGALGTGLAASGGGGNAGGGPGGGRGYQGGGFSGIFLSNAGGIAQSNAILIAGGGAAGGYSGNFAGGAGGYPTGSAPFSIGNQVAATLVLGGTQTAGGIGTQAAGSALRGADNPGDGGAGCGGGGGGWYGGGSHTSGNYGTGTGYAGGGGGSSFIGNLLGASPSPSGIGPTSSATYQNGITQNSYNPAAPGGTTSPFYQTGRGVGDINSSMTGTGLVVIVPATGTAATQIGVSAALYSG